MKNKALNAHQTNLYWLFNTPYNVYINGLRVRRQNSRKNAPSVFHAIIGHQSIHSFDNNKVSLALKNPGTARWIEDTRGVTHQMQFKDTQGKVVPLNVVYKYLAENEVYGYKEARDFSIFSDVCSAVPTSVLCDQWGITRSTLCLIINRLIRKSKFTESAKRDPAQFNDKGTTITGLRQHPEFWTERLNDLKRHVHSRLIND